MGCSPTASSGDVLAAANSLSISPSCNASSVFNCDPSLPWWSSYKIISRKLLQSLCQLVGFRLGIGLPDGLRYMTGDAKPKCRFDVCAANGLMYILSTGCQWRAIPKSASCSENSAIRPEVSGRTLRVSQPDICHREGRTLFTDKAVYPHLRIPSRERACARVWKLCLQFNEDTPGAPH
jgi:hypothetical protein